jgi:hypothetical protein
MKAISAVFVILLLSSCGGMGMSGSGGMGSSDYSGRSDMTPKGFDPNNPYHGGWRLFSHRCPGHFFAAPSTAAKRCPGPSSRVEFVDSETRRWCSRNFVCIFRHKRRTCVCRHHRTSIFGTEKPAAFQLNRNAYQLIETSSKRRWLRVVLRVNATYIESWLSSSHSWNWPWNTDKQHRINGIATAVATGTWHSDLYSFNSIFQNFRVPHLHVKAHKIVFGLQWNQTVSLTSARRARLYQVAHTRLNLFGSYWQVCLLEIEMKTKRLFGALALLSAAAVASPAFAEAGIRDGADMFSDFTSTKARSEVQRDLTGAKGQGTSVSVRDGEDAGPGAYGVAGSRYSMRTRDEIKGELANSSTKPHDPGSLYFGD